MSDHHDASTCCLRPPSLPLPERPTESKAPRLSGASENQPGSGKDRQKCGNAGGERGSLRGGRAGPAPPRAPRSAHARGRPAARGGMAVAAGARGSSQAGHTGRRRGRFPRPVTWPRVPRCRARIRPLGVAMAKAGRKRREGGTRGRSPAGSAHVPQARCGSGRWRGAVTGKGRCWQWRGRGPLWEWRSSLPGFYGSCLTCGVPLERLLSAARPVRGLLYPRILPAAWPCPRLLFHGEIRSEAAAGK